MQAAERANDKIVLAYITAGNRAAIEPEVLTHINYAFGTVKPSFDGVHVPRPDYLREIVAWKREYKQLKVLLSIGGWGAGGFSEMADNDTLRSCGTAGGSCGSSGWTGLISTGNIRAAVHRGSLRGREMWTTL